MTRHAPEATVRQEILDSIAVKRQLAELCTEAIANAATAILTSIQSGGKLLIFGNGGSAADAQHIAAELIGRYRENRAPIAAICLTCNTSSITAVANDYGFEETLSREIQAIAKPEDVALAISTSGNSPNVLRAIAAAKKRGVFVIGLTGEMGGPMRQAVDLCICVPSDLTARIQECHILIGHIICGIVEGAYVHASTVPDVRSQPKR